MTKNYFEARGLKPPIQNDFGWDFQLKLSTIFYVLCVEIVNHFVSQQLPQVFVHNWRNSVSCTIGAIIKPYLYEMSRRCLQPWTNICYFWMKLLNACIQKFVALSQCCGMIRSVFHSLTLLAQLVRVMMVKLPKIFGSSLQSRSVAEVMSCINFLNFYHRINRMLNSLE